MTGLRAYLDQVDFTKFVPEGNLTGRPSSFC